ncbi:MAG: hypothetical protein ABI570_05800 [Ilumatobacteraceae bacterium]
MTNNLEVRLSNLGSAFDIDERGLVESIDAQLNRASSANRRSMRRLLQIAAVAVLIFALVAVFHPDTRRAVANWFGLSQVRIERNADLDLLGAPITFELPGPGESLIIVVNGRQILASTIYGQIGRTMQKTLGSSTSIIEVDVGGHVGLWISGAPHEVMYETLDGHVAVERVAGNTLLWEVSNVLYRLEGFENLDDALEFVGTWVPDAVSD